MNNASVTLSERSMAAQQSDALLQPFLRATDEVESQRLLSELLIKHAEPLVKQIIKTKMRLSTPSDEHTSGSSPHEIEDISSEVLVQLLGRLRSYQTTSLEKPISSFRSYVAVTTYHACYEHLRQKYPQRHSLKNKLRYLLTHHEELALWEESGGGVWLCGLSDWRNRPRLPAVTTPELQQLQNDPQNWQQAVLPGQDVLRVPPANLLKSIFGSAQVPVELDDLTTIIAALWGVKDQPVQQQQHEGDAEKSDALERMPDPRASVVTETEQRVYLAGLWAEICQLPLKQRCALLLNLRDSGGGGDIIATLRLIAAALEISTEAFTELWNDLPLDDATIAARLGATRQQVTNLRKSARERLARRMNALERKSKLRQ